MPNLAWFALKRVNAQKGCSTTSLQSPIHIINLVDKINNLCMTWYDMILMLDQTKLTKVLPVKSDTEINLPIHNPSLFSSGILTALGTCIFIIYASISAHDKLSQVLKILHKPGGKNSWKFQNQNSYSFWCRFLT